MVPFPELLMMLGFNKIVRNASSAWSPKRVLIHPTFSEYNYVLIIIQKWIWINILYKHYLHPEMKELVRVEHNITVNLVHCQMVQANSRSCALWTIRISLRSVVERHQLGRYVTLHNVPFRGHFIAHIRFEPPKNPGVHMHINLVGVCQTNTSK